MGNPVHPRVRQWQAVASRRIVAHRVPTSAIEWTAEHGTWGEVAEWGEHASGHFARAVTLSNDCNTRCICVESRR